MLGRGEYVRFMLIRLSNPPLTKATLWVLHDTSLSQGLGLCRLMGHCCVSLRYFKCVDMCESHNQKV